MMKLKTIFAYICTFIVLVVLFALLFLVLKRTTPTMDMLVQIIIVSALVMFIKFSWYGVAEDKREEKEDFKAAKQEFYDKIDDTVVDIIDFEKFINYLNMENKYAYIRSKLRFKNKDNCRHFEKYKKWVYFRASRIKDITAIQILATTSRANIADATDYRKRVKHKFLGFSTVCSVFVSIVLCYITYDKFVFSYETLALYLTYVGSMLWAAFSGMSKGWVNTGSEYLDWVSRCECILDKYAVWKEGGHPEYASLYEGELDRICSKAMGRAEQSEQCCRVSDIDVRSGNTEPVQDLWQCKK